MKTKLCVQTFSNSVAVALGVCRELGIGELVDSEATQEFLSIIDRYILICRWVIYQVLMFAVGYVVVLDYLMHSILNRKESTLSLHYAKVMLRIGNVCLL